MELLLGFKSQPDFPREDLTDGNAAMLELLLQNEALLLKSHRTAEATAWLYGFAHPAVRQAGQRLAAVEPHLNAFSHGVAAYEAIAALVQATPVAKTDEHLSIVKDGVVKLSVSLGESALLNYVDEASELFKVQMPRTAEVVQASAERLQLDVAGYAIIGAGVARQFELSAA
jgi:hypothetical protein